MRTSFRYLPIFILLSCGQIGQVNQGLTSALNSVVKVATVKIGTDNTINDINLNKVINEEIEFDNFKVKLIDYSYSGEPKRSGDTVHLETELGKNLENKLIQIIPIDKSDKFKVYVALERSLTASLGEKQSEDLLDWKQFETYIELKGSNNYFRIIQFHEREKFEELNRDFKKIKTKIFELRGEYVTKELDSVTSIAYLPVALWVSRVILKITRIKPNGTRVTYYIDTVSPWGC